MNTPVQSSLFGRVFWVSLVVQAILVTLDMWLTLTTGASGTPGICLSARVYFPVFYAFLLFVSVGHGVGILFEFPFIVPFVLCGMFVYSTVLGLLVKYGARAIGGKS